jgi:hypothetical protein
VYPSFVSATVRSMEGIVRHPRTTIADIASAVAFGVPAMRFGGILGY